MMTIAVIDDEPHCADRILSLLEPYAGKVKMTCFGTADEAVNGIDTLRPDIVFLDVRLHGKTGFDVLRAITYRDFSLIFTTAYERYAIEAFKFSAIDYLLKPIDAGDFENAIQKAFKKAEQDLLNERIGELLSYLSTESLPKRISLPSQTGYSIVNISDITRCEADINYTHIFTSDGKKETVSRPLKHYEGLLTGHGFFRIHNSHLINLSYVKAYAKSGYVTLLDGTRLEVSVRKKEAFVKNLRRI